MVYKLIIFPLVIVCMLVGGFYMYRHLNRKIKASETWLHITFYSFLLLSGCTLLFFGGLFCLIKGYDWLMAIE